MPGFEDNPHVIKVRANGVCEKMDQEVVQICVNAQVKSSYYLENTVFSSQGCDCRVIAQSWEAFYLRQSKKGLG